MRRRETMILIVSILAVLDCDVLVGASLGYIALLQSCFGNGVPFNMDIPLCEWNLSEIDLVCAQNGCIPLFREFNC